MMDDYNDMLAVEKYAENKNYTLIANTGGALEYVKVCDNNERKILKWAKGSDFVVIKTGKKLEKINIDTITMRQK